MLEKVCTYVCMYVYMFVSVFVIKVRHKSLIQTSLRKKKDLFAKQTKKKNESKKKEKILETKKKKKSQEIYCLRNCYYVIHTKHFCTHSYIKTFKCLMFFFSYTLSHKKFKFFPKSQSVL